MITVMVLSGAAIIAIVSMTLVFRETQRRLKERYVYLSPITLFRKEMSLAGICTIASVVIWALLTPTSMWPASGAFLPLYLWFFLMTSQNRNMK